jgi:hypothetical protein
MKGINNKINKEFILRNVSQIEIFEKYTEISALVIQNCIDTNRTVQSPFRYDTNPSVGFRYNSKKKLKMRDFAGYFWGDCFDAACKVLNTINKTTRSVDKKEDFIFILHEIAREFDLLEGVKEKHVESKDAIRNAIINIKKEIPIIDIEFRDWGARADNKYWFNKYHRLLTVNDLTADNIYPVERFWINANENPEAKYYFTNNDPCYAYYDGVKDDIYRIKLYFPARSKDYNTHLPKFISNSQLIQRLHIFNDIDTKFDRIIITKARKDALILSKLLDMADYNPFSFTGLPKIGVIAYPQENYRIGIEGFEWLLSKLKEPNEQHIISFLDFDKTGIQTTNFTLTEYGMPYIFLTNGFLGLPNYGSKDISDFLEKNKIESTLNIINKIIHEKF